MGFWFKRKVLKKLDALQAGMDELLAASRRVVSIKATHETTSTVSPASQMESPVMAKAKVKLVKFGAPKKMSALGGGAHKTATPGNFGLVVGNSDGTLVTVNGVDVAGDLVDISSVATLGVVPSDPTIASVTVTGMSYTITLLKAGDVTFSITATWNDGSVGPFLVDDPCTVAPGPVTGLVVTHGNPVAP